MHISSAAWAYTTVSYQMRCKYWRGFALIADAHAGIISWQRSSRPARYGRVAPPCAAISFTFGYRSKKPEKIIRENASVVSIMKPIGGTRPDGPRFIAA